MKKSFQNLNEDGKSSYFGEKKLERCVSSTDVTNSGLRKSEAFIDYPEGLTVRNEKYSKPKQIDEFLFCLKLKMISISNILDIQELSPEKVEKYSATQILNQLTRKIKSFHKEQNRKLNEELNKSKSLEIEILNLESRIKTLECQQSHNKKAQQKNIKVYTLDIRKLENRIKECEQQKQGVMAKFFSSQSLLDEQSKNLIQMEVKKNELMKLTKNLENQLFDKEKQFAKLKNDYKFMELKFGQEAENLKKSIMRKTQQVNKFSAECKNLKQVIEGKDKKIQEVRNKYNKLYEQQEKSQASITNLQMSFQLMERKSKQEHQKLESNLHAFLARQNKISTELNAIELKILEKLPLIKSICEKLREIEKKESTRQNEVRGIQLRFDQQMKKVEQEHRKNQKLLRDEMTLEKRILQLDIEKVYKDKVCSLQEEIYRLKGSISFQ